MNSLWLFLIVTTCQYFDKPVFGQNLSDPIFSETELTKYLIGGYSPKRKPRKNSTDMVTVELELSLYAISELDLNKKVLVTASSMAFWWQDEYLVWEDHEAYSAFEYLVVDPSEVWMPPYLISNSLNQNILKHPRGLLIGYSPDGWAEYFPVAILETTCPVQLRYWPFDEHNCSFIFTSRSLTSDEMEFEPIESGIWNFYRLEESETWEIAEATHESGENCIAIEKKCFPTV